MSSNTDYFRIKVIPTEKGSDNAFDLKSEFE